MFRSVFIVTFGSLREPTAWRPDTEASEEPEKEAPRRNPVCDASARAHAHARDSLQNSFVKQ